MTSTGSQQGGGWANQSNCFFKATTRPISGIIDLDFGIIISTYRGLYPPTPCTTSNSIYSWFFGGPFQLVFFQTDLAPCKQICGISLVVLLGHPTDPAICRETLLLLIYLAWELGRTTNTWPLDESMGTEHRTSRFVKVKNNTILLVVFQQQQEE